jgi:xanthine/CO dehydrogenase XdhC/CoxF family maturation factor
MKEISRILEVYGQLDVTQRKVALATVVWVEGSSYRRPGARMLISDDGRWEGAISGGCLEGDALRKARQVMLDGSAPAGHLRHDGRRRQQPGRGPGLQRHHRRAHRARKPAGPAQPRRTAPRIRAAARRAGDGNRRQKQRRDLRPGRRFVRTAENAEDVPAWLAGDARSTLSGKPATRTFPLPAGTVDVFLERIDPGIELVIFGAGYDVIPLARLAERSAGR